MTISVVQTQTVSAAWSGNFGVNVTAGNTIFLVATGYDSAGNVISSSAPTFNGGSVSGAAKLFEDSGLNGAFNDYAAAWMLPNVAGGATGFGVTVTNSAAISNVGVVAYEVSGLGTAPVTDQLNHANGLSSAVSSGASGNITRAPEFVLGGVVQDNSVATIPGAPWASTSINPGGGNNSFAGYQIPVSSGSSYTYSATAGGAAMWAAGVVTVSAAATALPGRSLIVSQAVQRAAYY